MDILEALRVCGSQGIAVARYFYAHANERRAQHNLAAEFSMDPNRAGQIMRLAKDLFGSLEAEEAAKRTNAINFATEELLGVDTLLVMNKALNHLRAEAEVTKEDLRCECYKWAKGRTVAEAKKYANSRVRALNMAVESAEANRELRWLRISSNADANGMRYLILKERDEVITQIQANLMSQARAFNANRLEKQLADAAVNALNNKTAGTAKKREGTILLPADGLKYVDDNMLATTDGALIPADELTNHLLADYGYAILYAEDENDCPRIVNHYRTQRVAQENQRLALQADQLVCADPDCSYVAMHCQIHHITAWQDGGETNIENLTPACRPHNAQNDDDHSLRRNGYYFRNEKTGLVGYRSPKEGAPDRYNVNPIALKSGRRWALRHFHDHARSV
ncbi:MAG: HNH endonuclease signature motif containing protein [Corynebacterium sp.]|nr:HNH endonuclease signature motif containing protein [Corynebacterium sp.]